MLTFQNNKLIFTFNHETLWIEPWGDNAFRIRATKKAAMPQKDWALTQPHSASAVYTQEGEGAAITNGKLTIHVSKRGKITATNQKGQVILEEYCRNRRDLTDPKCSAIEVEGREFAPILGGDYRLTVRFESLDSREKIYGMGQYQQDFLDLKGADLELAHRNSQASVPFFLSSLGYGLLWNNPAVGRAVFGKNITSLEASVTEAMDYWLIAGDTPKEILTGYAAVTGTAPMMPEYGLGFWQCKLRYQTQEELLSVAREYKRRGLPIDVIVIDFFHWPQQGEWKFDPTYWPDPAAMVKELKELGIELMVSIWPTVDKTSENFPEMEEKGYLTRCDRGVQTGLNFMSDTIHFDATTPEARDYVWGKIKKNYYDLGIRVFWLDEAEPEYAVNTFDNYRYFKGPHLQIGNIYPVDYARTLYEGMEAQGQKNIVNLIRCAWAGSQRFGTLVWSGDIASSYESLRNQLCAGLNMGMAGIPWWTTDIGGFHGGDPRDPAFRELFVRWFQWGAFCPVMRLHGDREPRQPQVGTTGGAACCSGGPNEVWSYGPEVYEICKKYLQIREDLRPYTRSVMAEAHETGLPVMRTLFLEFPEDPQCWEVEDQYFFGSSYLVAPILNPGQRTRRVYLPQGASWQDQASGQVYQGGQWIEVPAPLDTIPLFQKI